MKKTLQFIEKEKHVTLPAILVILFFLSVSMSFDSASQQDKIRHKGKSKAELLDRLEKGDNITMDELKSAFSDEKEQEEEFFPAEEESLLPFYGFRSYENFDFRFEIPDFPEIPFMHEIPFLPEFPPFSSDFNFRYYDKWDTIPGIADEWNSGKFRDDISRAMEEARKGFDKFRKDDWLKIQEEIRKALDEMKKEMEELKDNFRNEKENNQVKKTIPII